MGGIQTFLPIAAVVVFAACAGRPEQGHASGFGAGTTSYLERETGAGPAPPPHATDRALERLLRNPVAPAEASAEVERGTGDELQQRERELRNALRGADGVGAALDLAALLCELERHREALGVLQSVRREQPDPVVAVALAGVHRDIGERHRAVAELRQLRREQGPLAMHPGLLFELAELEWLEGDGGGARHTLAELRRVHADDDWLDEHDDRLRGLALEIETAESPRRLVVRDLLGNLRGAPSPQYRLVTLDELIAIVQQPDAAPAVRALERRVIAIGAADPSAAVRARAIQLGPPPLVEAAAFFGAALADADPFVRGIAAARAAEVAGTDAAPWLLARLAIENDAAAFLTLHRALSELAGDDAVAGGATPPDEAARTALRAVWQQRRGGLGW